LYPAAQKRQRRERTLNILNGVGHHPAKVVQRKSQRKIKLSLRQRVTKQVICHETDELLQKKSLVWQQITAEKVQLFTHELSY
jgi:hypothetical protein